MFSRVTTSKQENNQNNGNKNINEYFELVQERNKDKLKECIGNTDYKIWELKDENGYTILHKSVFNSDMEITQLIIEEVKKRIGLNSKNALSKFLNEKTNEGLTVLHYAAYKGNIPMLVYLMKFGASIMETTNFGKNVLHMAAEGNQPSMIIYLISKENQSHDCVDENGSTPLHRACYCGGEEAVDFLISLGADINVQDKEKLTPLHLAVLGENEKIVSKLLQKNANKNLPNAKGELPIDLARKKNCASIVNILDDDDEINPLCSIESPKNYIEPNTAYKKIIYLMIIIPEFIIYLLILPYLYGWIETYINFPLFVLCLLSYFIFLRKDPGYRKNTELEKEAKNAYPLSLKVNSGEDVRNYCPKCYIQKAKNIKHCFICDKCVENFNHHCFWINKCIGKNNKFFYLLFIIFALLYTNHSLYICFELFWDDVNLPYDSKFLHIYLFKDRSIRVLGAAIVGVFCLIVGFPLFFLLFIEFTKLCEKKEYDMFDNIIKEAENKKDNKKPALELQGQDGEDDEHFAPLLPKNKDEENNIINNSNNLDDNNIIVNDNSNVNENDIIPEGEIKPSIIPNDNNDLNDNDNENDNILNN